MMKYRLGQIAEFLQARLEGDPDLEIEGIARIEEGKPGTISFLANPKYLPYAYTTQSTALIVGMDFAATQPVTPVLLRVADPYTAFTRLLEFAQQQSANKGQAGVHPTAFVDPTADVHQTAWVGPLAYIGPGATIGKDSQVHPQVYVGKGAKVGNESILFSGVSLYHDCVVGNKCIIHSGARIGSDGFGFAPQADGTFLKIPQTGNAVLEDEVEIGANTCIDRATIGSTVVRFGAKIDNLVQIAHNVEVGEHTVIAAQTGVSGSTKIGKYCMIGGQVGIGGHIQIADRSQIGARSGLVKSIRKPGLAWRGAPVQEISKQLRQEVLVRQLELLVARITELEQALSLLQEKGQQP